MLPSTENVSRTAEAEKTLGPCAFKGLPQSSILSLRDPTLNRSEEAKNQEQAKESWSEYPVISRTKKNELLFVSGAYYSIMAGRGSIAKK